MVLKTLKKHNLLTSVGTAIFLVFFASCSATATVQAKKDCSTDIQIEADIGKTVYDTIKTITAGMNQIANTGASTANSQEIPVFSTKDTEQALSAGGITNVSVTTPSATSLSAKGTLPAPADQKTVLDGKGIKLANFVTCTKNSLTVILSPETIQQTTAALTEESRSYLDLLMAPVFTGEEMSASEYEDLIAAVYGTEMEKELASSLVKITLVTPAGCTLKKSAIADGKNVKTSGDRAVFTIPLTEFLTLQTSQTFSITW